MRTSDSLSSMLTAPTSLWRTCLSACCVIVIQTEVYELKVGGRFSECSLTHLPFPLPWVSLATNYTRYPPKSPHTPPLKFMCHLLITELVNVSPPSSSSSQSVCCCSPMSAVFLFSLLLPDHLPHSSPLLSASLSCELMITVTNSALVYKLLLWFRPRCCHCCCLLL